MVSLMSFFLFLFILPDIILCAETKSQLFVEDAEGNRFYLGFLPGNERLPEKPQMKLEQSLPESFDAREQWPECKDIIGLIRDQKHCGSCWAFSIAEIISDRICIQSNGSKQVVISPEDLMTCSSNLIGCHGCGGGDPAKALNYWVQTGIVTGGDYNSHEGCSPYTIPDNWNENTPPCNKTCEEGYPIAYEADKHYGVKAYSINSDVKQIQQEIYDNGPVSAAFLVYGDFFKYKNGVYRHASKPDKSYGGHAIKIIGWGEEDGTPYWLCANSWNTEFGENGYFKILRGDQENNCGIEAYVNAGTPKL